MSIYRSVIFIFSILLLSACKPSFLNSGRAALKISSAPDASVFLDGKQVGDTPYYNDQLKPGEVTLRLVPKKGGGIPWEGRISLNQGIETQVTRELGDTQERSGGYVISMSPSDNKANIGLVIVSSPSGANVTIDQAARGFAPIEIDDLQEGEHPILISYPGYYERTLKVNLVKNYKVNISVQLVKSPEDLGKNLPKAEEQKQSDESDSDKVLDKDLENKKDKDLEKTQQTSLPDPPYITVKDTPTGWLNVRKTPSTAEDNIIIKIKPKEHYKYLDKNESGWYKISLNDGTEGWVSSKYVSLTK